MTPDMQLQVRAIIRDELSALIKAERYVFEKNLQIADGRFVQLGRSYGTKFASDVDQKLGFWGVTPVVQPSSSSQAAVSTSAATNVVPYGYSQTQANGIVTLLNALRSALVSAGIIKGSA